MVRSYALISVSLAYRKWGTRLQNYEQLIYRSERLMSKIVPYFFWRPHFRKDGCLSEDDCRIVAVIL